MKLYSQTIAILVSSLFAISNSMACDTTLWPSDDLSTEINGQTGPHVFCLNTGAYNESDRILPKANVTIKGLGTTSTQTVINSAATIGIKIDFADDVTLQKFTLDGADTNMTTSGVFIESSDGATLSSIRINNLGGQGLAINNSTNVDVSYMTIDDSGLKSGDQQAVWTNESSYVTLDNVHMLGNNKTYGNDGSLTSIESDHITITNLRSYNSGSGGVAFRESTDFEVADSEFYYTSNFGMDIAAGTAGGHIHDNYIFGSGHTAISLSDHTWTSPGGYNGTAPDDFLFEYNDMVSNNQTGVWDGKCDDGGDIQAIVLVNDPTNVTIGTGNTSNIGPVSCESTQP